MKRTCLWATFILSLVLLYNPLGYAEKLLDQCLSFRSQKSTCRTPELSSEQVLSSLKLSDQVQKKLLEIEKIEKNAGRKFKIAIINRQGLDLDYLSLLKDQTASGQQRSVEQLITEATTEDPNFSFNKTVDYTYFSTQKNKNEKLDFTHLGILVRNDPRSHPEDGDWRVYQLLWSCENNHSEIHTSYTEKFFLDELSAYRSQIMLLPLPIQDQIEDLLLNHQPIAKQLHANVESYNAAANWKILTEQNSNQWVLEILAAALKPLGQITTREEALQTLIETNYQPSQVFLSGIYNLVTFPGAYKVLPNTACLKNQKYALNYGIGEIVTSLSVLKYLKKNQILTSLYEVDTDAR